MSLSASAISEFKEIYESEIGTELSDKEASMEAMKLLKFVSLIYKPISKNIGGSNE